MKKGLIKYCVDVMMFITLSSIAAIGLIMEFFIPSGGGTGPSEKFFLGLHRHDWGEIHLFFGILFLILIVVHLSSKWSFITQSTKNYFGDKWQKALLAFSMAWIAVLFVAWVLAKV